MSIGNPRAEVTGKAIIDKLAEEAQCKHSWVPEGGLIQDGTSMVCEKCGQPKEQE